VNVALGRYEIDGVLEAQSVVALDVIVEIKYRTASSVLLEYLWPTRLPHQLQKWAVVTLGGGHALLLESG
jgi:hypothetical protein